MPAPADYSAIGSPQTLTGNRLLARNAVWNLVTQCIPMVVALLTMPWLIQGLGPHRFGILTLSWMVLGYFSLFDLGLGRALTKLSADLLGQGRLERLPELIGTALALMTGLGLAGTLVVCLLTPRIVGLLQIEPPLQAEARGAFYLMAAALPFIGTAGLRRDGAHQKFGAINTIRTLTSSSSDRPACRSPLHEQPRVRGGCRGTKPLPLLWPAHVAIVLRSVPGLTPGMTIRGDVIRPLGFGGWMTAVNLINPLMVQMDRFLIAGLASAAAVTFYTTPYELVTKSWFLSNAVLGVMFPAFAASAVVDRRRTAELLGRCLRHVGLILFPVVLGGIGLGAEVLHVWVGPEFAARSTRVLQWLCLGVLARLGQVLSALIQESWSTRPHLQDPRRGAVPLPRQRFDPDPRAGSRVRRSPGRRVQQSILQAGVGATYAVLLEATGVLRSLGRGLLGAMLGLDRRAAVRPPPA
ncbi:MAG: flippase [Isosphaeraceae bacterium]